jgi:hypothetical protein
VAELPECCNINNRWRKKFIPTYIWFVSRTNDPWAIEDSVALSAMKKIWTKVYGAEKHTIATDGPVFSIVSTFCILDLFSSITGSATTV